MAENLYNEMSLVRIEELRHCLVAAFERLELPPEDAEQVADVLLDSELRGHESHGIHLRGFLVEAYRGGMNPRPRVRVLRESEGALLLDGTAATWWERCARCVGASSAPASSRAWR